METQEQIQEPETTPEGRRRSSSRARSRMAARRSRMTAMMSRHSAGRGRLRALRQDRKERRAAIHTGPALLRDLFWSFHKRSPRSRRSRRSARRTKSTGKSSSRIYPRASGARCARAAQWWTCSRARWRRLVRSLGRRRAGHRNDPASQPIARTRRRDRAVVWARREPLKNWPRSRLIAESRVVEEERPRKREPPPKERAEGGSV